jgi:hypothetical protein
MQYITFVKASVLLLEEDALVNAVLIGLIIWKIREHPGLVSCT